MKLFHVTPQRNKVSIMKHGLLVSRAMTLGNTIWLVSRDRVAAAVDHVRIRHGTRDVVVLYVDVNRRKLRNPIAGVYGTTKDITPRQILGELAWEG